MKPASEGIYLYALAEPDLPRHFIVLGRRLRNLPIGDVAAVIEKRAPPDFTTDAVRQQHAIITRLTSRLPVLLPARFGSVTDERCIASAGLAPSARNTRGVRAGPRVRPDDGSHFRHERRNARVNRGLALVQERSFSSGQGNARNTSHPRRGSFARRRRPMSKAERIAAGERQGLLTVFHLVPLGRLDLYRQRASGLQSMLPRHVVTVTGPWPVFAFAPELF